jgi:hypothetical protein
MACGSGPCHRSLCGLSLLSLIVSVALLALILLLGSTASDDVAQQMCNTAHWTLPLVATIATSVYCSLSPARRNSPKHGTSHCESAWPQLSELYIANIALLRIVVVTLPCTVGNRGVKAGEDGTESRHCVVMVAIVMVVVDLARIGVFFYLLKEGVSGGYSRSSPML